MIGREAYLLGMVGLLAVGYVPYRKVLAESKFRSRNLFLSRSELWDLKSTGKANVEGTEIEGFRYEKYLDAEKPTVIIEMDGASGLILAGILRKTGKYNIVCLSREANLLSTSSGAVPFYQRVCRVYKPSLQFVELLGAFGGQRSSYLVNYVRARLGKTITEEDVNRVEQTNTVGITPWVGDLEPARIPVRYVCQDGTEQELQLLTYNKRFLLQKIVEDLTFMGKPDLLINSANISRSVFSVDEPKKFLGVATDLGVVLGDYYILSTEKNSVKHAEKFGLQLPIHTRTYSFTDAPPHSSNLVDEINGRLVIGGKQMVEGKPADSQMSTSMEVSPDGLPIVDRVQGFPNSFVNLGYGGNAFTAGFAGAVCIREMLESPGNQPCKPLGVDRFMFV